MASAAPSSLFARLTNVWRHLVLRSDVDDIILESLGRFSLDKIYAGPSDCGGYQQLVITLLVQLNIIFFIQRLTLPAASTHAGYYLGFLVSWEVTMRCIEFVLQVLVEGRESLWEEKRLRDKYLAEFLLSALRVLSLHPRPPANLRIREKKERLGRIHRLLEQVFDSYSGPKSFLLVVARDVTRALQSEPSVLDLPERLKYELPNLVNELYPLPECMSSDCIAELVPDNGIGISWLAQFLALRDIAKITVGASIQYSVNQETSKNRNVHLQSSSARVRSAILKALDNIQMPSNFSQVELVSHFSASFRIILPDTLDMSQVDGGESHIDDYEIDALDSFCERLGQRQVIHRVSDLDTAHGISRVLNNIVSYDTPGDHFHSALPEIYVLNCPQAHIAGIGQLRDSNIFLTSDPADSSVARLSPSARCVHCNAPITRARELLLAKQTWQTLTPLKADADTVNVERHLPSQFHLSPQRQDSQTQWSPYSGGPPVPRRSDPDLHPSPFSRLDITSPTSLDHERNNTHILWSQNSLSPRNDLDPNRSDTMLRSDGSTCVAGRPDSDQLVGSVSPKQEILLSADHIVPSQDYMTTRRGSLAPSDTAPAALSPTGSLSPKPLRPSLSKSVPKKSKSKWKMPFGSTRKGSTGASGDTSSISSGALEAQKLEEIPLLALASAQKASGRGRGSRNISVQLSQSSTLALFWTQLMLQVCDVSTSPPTLLKTVSTDSSCLVAAVAQVHLAYVIGSRDKRLTLRIVNLARPSAPVVEHRMPSSAWCKSIAIDPKENYVAVGFENSVVRFFKTTSAEQFREDRLHGSLHSSCANCPSVDTLSFSQDGLALLASTRHHKNGYIQLYCWRFPFESFQELRKCWFQVPLHESEDNGISSAVLRTNDQGADPLICVTTWTQSGAPLLIQPRDGHKSEIRTESGRQSKIGTRVQCAAFSSSGREMALVNEKGNLYQITNLDSSPLDIRRIATSKELTAKTDSFAMNFMTWDGEEYIVMAWVDPGKSTAWVKKVPTGHGDNAAASEEPGVVRMGSSTSIAADIPEEALELPGDLTPFELAGSETRNGQ